MGNVNQMLSLLVNHKWKKITYVYARQFLSEVSQYSSRIFATAICFYVQLKQRKFN